VIQACAEGCDDLTLVTNDLNMLLKAQTLGIRVERRAELEGGFAKKYIIRPFQRYKIPLGILAIALAVFAGVLALSLYTTNLTGARGAAGVPTEFRDLLTTDQRDLLDGLVALEADPTNVDATRQVGDALYNLNQSTRSGLYAQKAIEYYTRYLTSRPDDHETRANLAAMYFTTGLTDRAIQEATTVTTEDPQHVQATFLLGIFYWQGRQDYETAAKHLVSVLDLTRDATDPHDQVFARDASSFLAQVSRDAEAAGRPLDIDLETILGGSL